MTIKYYPEMLQGSPEWFAARCGLLTASEMNLIITPKKLEPVKTRDGGDIAHMYELLAQRVTQYVEPSYISFDMLRGKEDEPLAKALYNKTWGGVQDCGFVTNDKWGFTLGCSPDWLVGDDGGGECKSRNQALQMKAIITGELPDENRLQVQTQLLVTERKWWDYTSYSGGMVMKVIRVYPDPEVQAAILTAATLFENRLNELLDVYNKLVATNKNLIMTERRKPEATMTVGETT